MMRFFNNSKFCQKAWHCRGLTLMELLIVVSLMGGVSLVIYNAFSNGMKVWKRSQEVAIDEDAMIFFEKITHDLRNVYIHAKTEFEGTELRFRFPAMILAPKNDTRAMGHTSWVEQPGQVEYYFDLAHRQLIRRAANYGQMISYESGQDQVLIEKVKALKFEYIYYGEDRQDIYPSTTSTFPVGVNIYVTYLASHDMDVTIERFIDIPLSL